MCFTIKNIYNEVDVKSAWNTVVKDTMYAWFWSEYYEHCFRITVLKLKGVFFEDKSFFIYDKEKKLCGLVPLVFIKSSDYNGLEASYDKPLPWPMVMSHMQNNVLIHEFIFTKIDELLRDNNVKKISLEYSPPNYKDNFSEMFSSVMRKYKYIDNSFMSHYVNISSDTLNHVRKRYKRYVKKYNDTYSSIIINKNDISMSLIRKYMELHVKDSGALYRPLETYVAQFDYIIKGDGFLVQSEDKETGKIVGMLIVCVSKDSAYDGSVAVDPVYQKHFISHLMKWKAIQHLQDININHYELGMAAENDSYLRQPSKKSYGISFFKDGWSRGNLKKIVIFEKYFSKTKPNKVCNKKIANLANFFEI